MIRLRLKDKSGFEYPDDCQHIVDIFATRGYEITIRDAESAWEWYSDSVFAGWMVLDDDDDHVFIKVMKYLEEVLC